MVGSVVGKSTTVVKPPWAAARAPGAGRQNTGDQPATQPERPRMVAVMLGTAALVAAAAWFIFGRS